MNPDINWAEAVKPLLKKYKGNPHPLEYRTLYELMVMVILAARDSDKHINSIAPALFKTYPDMRSLSGADANVLQTLITGVTNYKNKTQWLLKLAQTIGDDKKIPLTMEELTKLPGIGRKTANVIMHEAKVKPAGVIVDLHVVRVAPRLGIADSTDPDKIEQQIMQAISQKLWGETGMAFSFHGREICRPKPLCPECIVKNVCEYYHVVVLKENKPKQSRILSKTAN
jgi:endonuclease-3